MRIRTTFSLLCLFLMMLLPFAVHADPCATYQSDYDSKDTAYRTAMDNLLRANVAVLKATPYAPVSPDLSDLEEEYDSDTPGFLRSLKSAMDVHPNMPTRTGAFINEILNIINMGNIRAARSAAVVAVGAAKAAREAARRALEACKGSPVQIVWCERGSDCQTPPGVEGIPRGHFVFECPDKISGFLGIKVDCPGTWWSCGGMNTCPRSSDHVKRTCQENAWYREPVTITSIRFIRNSYNIGLLFSDDFCDNTELNAKAREKQLGFHLRCATNTPLYLPIL